jgi:large subunit ribosomal protein L24e
MVDCSFCGNSITQGTGIIYVRKTGKRFDFCSRKCEKNLLLLKRSPRKFKWTQEYWKEKGLQQKKVKAKTEAKDVKATGKKKVKKKKKKK